MFYFTERVVELKAWQLYLGNAFWTLFVGLILLVIAKVLGLFGLDNNAVDNLLDRAGQIAEARNPEVLTGLANHVLQAPGQMIGSNQNRYPSPTHSYYS